MSSDKGGRLSRWSQRKTEARTRRGGATPELEVEPQGQLPAATDEQAALDDAPPPDLPDVETLTPDSDFSQFMRDGVPTALRKLALRKLWAGDPALTELDDMLEYGEDFTDGGALIAKMADPAEKLKGDGKKPAAEPDESPADEPETRSEDPETVAEADADTQEEIDGESGSEDEESNI